MATAFVLGPQGYTVTRVLRVWVSLTSYSHIFLSLFKDNPYSGRAPGLSEGRARLLPASGHVSSLRNTAVWCR